MKRSASIQPGAFRWLIQGKSNYPGKIPSTLRCQAVKSPWQKHREAAWRRDSSLFPDPAQSNHPNPVTRQVHEDTLSSSSSSYLTTNAWETTSQDHPAEPGQPTGRGEIVLNCCLKLPSFMVCYVTIDNQITKEQPQQPFVINPITFSMFHFNLVAYKILINRTHFDGGKLVSVNTKSVQKAALYPPEGKNFKIWWYFKVWKQGILTENCIKAFIDDAWEYCACLCLPPPHTPPLTGTQNKIPNAMEGLSLRKDEGLQQS